MGFVHSPDRLQEPLVSQGKGKSNLRTRPLYKHGQGRFVEASWDKAFKFIDSLKLAKNLANLGDAKTLVLHPSTTIFHEFSTEQQINMDVTDDMVRVSVGIEDFEDIKDDFEQAIEKAFEVDK